MSKRLNIVYDVVTILLTLVAVFFSVYICNNRYNVEIKDIILYLILGFVLAVVLCAILHELGHLIFGKINNFYFISMKIWFIKIYSEEGKIKVSFCSVSDNIGATEMVCKDTENIGKKFGKMTVGGLVFSFVSMLIGIVPLIIANISVIIYCLLVLFLPVGCYFFVGNLLPISDCGFRSDGAVLLGLKRKDNDYLVTENLLKIQSELFNGKTPGEINKELYFNLPQLPEDDINFIILLTYRYMHYIDNQDYENAIKVTERLLSLEDYMPKSIIRVAKTYALYNYCTFNKDYDKADDFMYELEKYLNNINTAENVRVKLCYVKNVLKENENVNIFIEKAKREANKMQLEGLKKYEQKLIEKME